VKAYRGSVRKGGSVITRVWRGRAPADRAQEYVRAFAGPDYETAVVADEAREVLVRFDDRVGHYDTALETS
jgi:hypothetical protein